MSDEEIKKALEIIKNKAINIEIVNDIVDKKEYIGFDKDNFEILEQCYYNCQYFARNLEQLMINLKDKDKEIKRLNNIIKEIRDNWNDKTEDKVYLKMSKETLVKTINIKRNTISYIRIKRDKLQARIDKAIEYIENNYPVCAGSELLDILKGSDKE